MPYFHVWFATKGRRKLLQEGDVLNAVREFLPRIAEEKSISLLEFEAIIDHVHLLIELEDKASLPRAMMLLKAFRRAGSWSAFLRFGWTHIRTVFGRLAMDRRSFQLQPSLQPVSTFGPNGIDSNPTGNSRA